MLTNQTNQIFLLDRWLTFARKKKSKNAEKKNIFWVSELNFRKSSIRRNYCLSSSKNLEMTIKGAKMNLFMIMVGF